METCTVCHGELPGYISDNWYPCCCPADKHSDCIPCSSLPRLPEGWSGPFEAMAGEHRFISDPWEVMVNDPPTDCIAGLTKGQAEFLAALLNVAYPTAEGGK